MCVYICTYMYMYSHICIFMNMRYVAEAFYVLAWHPNATVCV